MNRKLKVVLSLICTLILLCANFVLFAEAYDNKIQKSGQEIIGTYDYISKTETFSVLDFSESSVDLNRSNNLNNNVTYPAYIPEGVEVADFSNESDGGGTMNPMSIIQNNTKQVSNINVFPYSAVLFVDAIWATSSGFIYYEAMASAFVVGQKVIVTAAHVMHDSNYGWASQFRVHVKQNGKLLNTQYYYPQSWSYNVNYPSSHDINYDWCVVKMQDPIGNQTGWFGRGNATWDIRGYSITSSGYQGSDFFYQNYSTGKISSQYLPMHGYRVAYDADVVGGQSGGPVYDNNHTAWAINTGGNLSPLYNYGSLFTAAVNNIINNML